MGLLGKGHVVLKHVVQSPPCIIIQTFSSPHHHPGTTLSERHDRHHPPSRPQTPITYAPKDPPPPSP